MQTNDDDESEKKERMIQAKNVEFINSFRSSKKGSDYFGV